MEKNLNWTIGAVKQTIFILAQVLGMGYDPEDGLEEKNREKAASCFYERLEMLLKITFSPGEQVSLKTAYDIKEMIVKKLAVSDNPEKEEIIQALKWVWSAPLPSAIEDRWKGELSRLQYITVLGV